jgi:hypothetical protein
MEKKVRLVYSELAKEVNASLCTFCRYGEWYADGCCEGHSECQHPLEYRFPHSEEMLEPSMDCWGFRPGISVSLVADLVGAIVSQGYDGWFYRIYSPKSVTVYGRRFDQGVERSGKVRIG